MAKKTDKKIIITVVIMFLLVAALGLFAFYYEAKQIQNISDTIQKKKLESLVLQEKKDKIFKLKKDLKGIEDYKSEMDKTLISKDDAVSFIRSIEGIAAGTSNSVKIESADLSKLKLGNKKTTSSGSNDEAATPKTQASQIAADQAAEKARQDQTKQIKNKIGFTIELLGTYPATVDFLDKMENLPYFINIFNMDLTSQAKLTQATATTGGALPAENLAAGQTEGANDKNIKTTILVIVNTNDGN
jgi:Tfp pilus assembly protein PilO